EGMFLGYMISLEGIKPCPDKTEVVLQLPSPRTIKEVQSLNGKLASLNRFLSKSAEKSLPLFKTLKKCIKKSDFHWTPEAEQAFKQLKQHLSELPLLVAPKPKKELIVYLSASYGAVCVVLMTERGTVQTPVYFVSRALQGPKLNYAPIEKLVLALVFAAKRLQRYFQAHLIVHYAGRTQYHVPAKDIRERTDPSGFPCREARRSTTRYVSGRNTSRAVDIIHGRVIMCRWVRRWPDTDKSGGNKVIYTLRFQFTASNNEAEYEALIAGLRIAAQMGVHNLHVSVDSKLVANQVLRTYIAKEENMVKYIEKARNLISGFANFSISQVPRSKNKKADALSKIVSTSFAHLSKQVLVKILKEKSIQKKEVATVVKEEGPTWMTPIVEYLRDETFPDDKKEASKLRIKARQYELVEGVLYRRSFLTPWLRCVGPLQADYVIREIHEGSCSMHAGPRSVVAKAMRLGYYWPTMHRDAREMIRASGPFPEGPGKVKFLIVAMDYFTKWIEAKAMATITGNQVKKFMWDNIRFASVKHSQSNRLVERANRSLGKGIKARLGEGNKNWIEELPHVLWAHQRREYTAIREAKAKLKMTKNYNVRVCGVTFRPGDFVYHSNEESHAMDGGKLGPKWEGPYEVTEALGDGAYRIRSLDGTVLPRTWNIANLKKCYL
ncbi:reverse transcriptase domain-containing protein, partial [Tanacetum coccineum]